MKLLSSMFNDHETVAIAYPVEGEKRLPGCIGWVIPESFGFRLFSILSYVLKPLAASPGSVGL